MLSLSGSSSPRRTTEPADEALWSFEVWVTLYKLTWPDIPEDLTNSSTTARTTDPADCEVLTGRQVLSSWAQNSCRCLEVAVLCSCAVWLVMTTIRHITFCIFFLLATLLLVWHYFDACVSAFSSTFLYSLCSCAMLIWIIWGFVQAVWIVFVFGSSISYIIFVDTTLRLKLCAV